MIYTHQSVDLDAVASFWAWVRFTLRRKGSRTRIKFVPANWDGKGMGKNDIALDITAGGRGLKGDQGLNGTIHSCFSSVVKKYCDETERYALKELVRYVDGQDSTGNGAKALGLSGKKAKLMQRISPNEILRGLKLKHHNNDIKVCKKMFELFDCMLLAGEKRSEAWKRIEEAEWISDGVVIAKDMPEESCALLFRNGAKVVIFAKGNNLGMLRGVGTDIQFNHPDILRVIGNEKNEWFLHPQGYIFCRGTKKSPAQTPSKVNTKKLAEVMAGIIS